MADGAAEIENGLGLECGVGGLQPEGRAFADVIEVLAHQAEGEHREAVFIDGAGGKVCLVGLC